MRGASSIRYMLRSGGARFCTLIVIIVLGTLYLPSFPSHSEEEGLEVLQPPENKTLSGKAEKAVELALSDARGRHRCPVPRSSKTRAIDHGKQACVPLGPRSESFAVSLCYERDAYDAFTVRVRRLDQRACARIEERGPQVDDEEVRKLVRTTRGPDTFWLRVDGAERISTQRSVYEGGCSYRFDVPVRNAGDLYVELFHAWEVRTGFDFPGAS